VHVGHHVAKEFIIDFIRFEKLVQRGSNGSDFLHDRCPGFPVEMEQLGDMRFGYDEGVTGKELVAVYKDVALLKFRYPEIRFGVPFCTHPATIHIEFT
jgi:hypothetical protein